MFKDINRIRPAALYFLKHGHYTSALPGTREYYEFWDEEKKIEVFKKKFTLTFTEIAELLNSYNIKARCGSWNSGKVNRIFNQYFNTIENKMASINLNI